MGGRSSATERPSATCATAALNTATGMESWRVESDKRVSPFPAALNVYGRANLRQKTRCMNLLNDLLKLA